MLPRLFAILLLPLALVTLIQAVSVIQQDIALNALESETGFWGQANYQPTAQTRRDTHTAMQALLLRDPDNAIYLTLQANQQAWEAFWAEDMRAFRLHAEQAIAAQAAAQRARPAFRQGWQLLLAYSEALNAQNMVQQAEKQLAILDTVQQGYSPATGVQ